MKLNYSVLFISNMLFVIICYIVKLIVNNINNNDSFLYGRSNFGVRQGLAAYM